MNIGELLVILFLISLAIICFFMIFYVLFEPGGYKVLGFEKYIFAIVFLILGIILICIAFDRYMLFTQGIHIIKEFLQTEVVGK